MKRRRKKRILQITVMVISILALLVVAGIVYIEMRPMVAKAVTVEAGTPSIDVEDFLLNKEVACNFITDIESISLDVPGIYEIEIQIKRRIHSSNLVVVDTVAPIADPVPVIALIGEELDPLSFVTNIIDASEVKATFVSEPDILTPGVMDVEIALEDAGNNISLVQSNLTILDVKSSISVEAGTILDVKPQDFVSNDNIRVGILTNLSELDISRPTVHPIEIVVDGRRVNSSIDVVDTTPPTASPVNKDAWKGEPVLADVFVGNVNDISDVKIYYGSEPDFEAIGRQEITVVIEDAYGNKAEVKPIMTVKEDTEPPVFKGIQNQTVFEGDTISYRKGVSVKDNKDADVEYRIDSSKVNLGKVGTYKVYYTAEDSAGNKASETATITVDKFIVTDEMLYEKVDKVLAKITKDGMTKKEVAYEIYLWVKGHVAYTGSSDKSDWKKEAYRGITNGLGDCYTYYAVSEAFLTRAGIDNMLVTRVGGRTQHFWNLIDCGDGWYHFDTCPNKDKMDTFMLTDAEVEAYTIKRGNNYYNFDKSLYPATPEK